MINLLNFDVDVKCASTLKAGGRRETASRSRAIYFCDQPDDVCSTGPHPTFAPQYQHLSRIEVARFVKSV